MQKKPTVRRARMPKVKPEFAPSVIVAPTDFSELSNEGLARAAGLALQYGATLLLVHVVEPIIYPVDYLVVPKEMEEGNFFLAENARKRLAELKASLSAQNILVKTEVRVGKPYLEIADLAKKKKAGLVVLATHGHTGLKHFYMGSTAEKLVRHAPCSVMVVR